jgi:uncharacterized membrane protein YjfL (UPF0719 family)
MTAAARCLTVALLGFGSAIAAFADTNATTSALSAESGLSLIWPVLNSLGALVLGFIQLILGLSLAAFVITKGLSVLSKLLGGIDIWEQIKRRNPAVALLAAGVVISYCTVISGGIESMTRALFAIGADPFGGLVGLFSGVLNLVIAVMVASFAITVVFKVMDRLTVGIDERAELADGNIAVGILYCGTLIGVSGLVASGVNGIGTGVGMLLSSIIHLLMA